MLQHAPIYFWDRNIFGSFIHDRPGSLTHQMPGAGNIMWLLDYPHSETTCPHSQDVIKTLLAGVADADRDMIIGGRARALFKLLLPVAGHHASAGADCAFRQTIWPADNLAGGQFGRRTIWGVASNPEPLRLFRRANDSRPARQRAAMPLV